MDDLYILCTKPPTCVLFQRDNSEHSKFDGLDSKIVTVFPLERSITVKGHSVRRRQLPMCPAFSLTDYKVQGSTLTTAVLDLKHQVLEAKMLTRNTVLIMPNYHDSDLRKDCIFCKALLWRISNSARTSDCS